MFSRKTNTKLPTSHYALRGKHRLTQQTERSHERQQAAAFGLRAESMKGRHGLMRFFVTRLVSKRCYSRLRLCIYVNVCFFFPSSLSLWQGITRGASSLLLYFAGMHPALHRHENANRRILRQITGSDGVALVSCQWHHRGLLRGSGKSNQALALRGAEGPQTTEWFIQLLWSGRVIAQLPRDRRQTGQIRTLKREERSPLCTGVTCCQCNVAQYLIIALLRNVRTNKWLSFHPHDH